MTHAEAGSRLPASDFWETADRLVGANGALIARYDELVRAKTAHLAEQQTKRRARAHATAQQLTAAPPLKPELTSPAFATRDDTLLQLAGEIFFDANKYGDAAYCYALAATASKEGDTFDLWACAITRHAFIEIYERRLDKAAPMLELAARLAQRGDKSLSTRYWISAVQAQAFAGLGKLAACQRALDAAEQVCALSGDVSNGGWLRFDGSRLAEERGACYVQLQRPDLAEAALGDALRQNLSARRRGGVLTDLAIIGVQRGDANQLVTYADAVLEIAVQTGSGFIGRKLQGLQSHLVPLLGNGEVRQLNQRIMDVCRGVR